MLALHENGQAHAFAVWRGEKLIGGMYGLAMGGAIFGESMFSRERDGSKMALAWAVDHLRRSGFILFDTQFLTPHLKSLGAIGISRSNYRTRLAKALELEVDLRSLPLETDPQAVVQRITQTSNRA